MESLKHIIIALIFISVSASFSQVGVGTTSPDASSVLDVVATDKGLLVPRVNLDNIATTMLDGVNTAATGLLIYNTNTSVIGGNGAGYYYFNGTIWEPLKTASAASDHDFYEEGTTDAPNSINDDIFTQGNVAIGKTTATYALDVESDGVRGTNTTVNGSSNADIYGHYIQNSNSGTGEHYGSYNRLNGTGDGQQNGTYQFISNTGSANHIGCYNELTGAGDGSHFGVSNRISGVGNGLKRGIFNFILNTGSGEHVGMSNSLSGDGDGNKYGVKQQILSDGDGNHYGTYSLINNSGSGIHYGTNIALQGSASGTQIGASIRIESSGNGVHSGTRSYLEGAGTGDKYGTHNFISAAAGGTHYGIFSSALKPGSFAGYFIGSVSIGNSLTNNYIFPSSPGTNGQIMQIDASGNLNWLNPSSIISASNGISLTSGDVVLGGTLTQATTITQGTNNLIFNLNNSGDFLVQDAGVNHFEVRSTGLTYFGDDTYWNDGSTAGTTIASLIDDGDDGRLRIYENGSTSIDLDANTGFIFNEQGLDRDFRVESDDETSMFRVDAANNRIGVMEATPSFDIHLKQSTRTEAGTGGIGFESSDTSNTWKLYHSGTNFSLSENGIRRGYIQSGTGNYIPTSDRRLKKSITEVESILDKVHQLKAYRYLYKDQDSSAKKTIGFMAQDILPLFPELVGQAEDGYFGLNYAGFGIIAIKAIQEQQDLIETQRQQIEALQKLEAETTQLLQRLLERIENLENQD